MPLSATEADDGGDAAFGATTQRLVLRRFRPEDLDAFVAYPSPETAATRVGRRPTGPAKLASSCGSWRPFEPGAPEDLLA